MKRKHHDKRLMFFSIFIIIGIIFSTIAYASTTYNLEADGQLQLNVQEGVIISNVNQSSISQDSSFTVNHYIDTLLTTTINLGSQNSEVILEVTVKNMSNSKYRLSGILYDTNANPELGLYNNQNIVPEITTGTNGLQSGDIINENETRKVYVRYYYNGNDFSGTNPGLLDGTIKINFLRLYNITYNLNGGTQAANQPTYYAAGDSVTLLDPTKANSTFMGWYENENFTGSSLNNLNGKTGDITLYAKFITQYHTYFQVPPDWYKNPSDEDYTVKMYLYKSSDKSSYVSWPGVTMEKYNSSTPNIFASTITNDILEQYDRVVFSNGNIPSTGGETYYEIDKTKRQTIDLSFSQDKWAKIFVPELYNKSNEARFFGRSNQNLRYYLWNNTTGVADKTWPGRTMSNSIGDSGFKFTFNKTQFDRMIINKGDGSTNTIAQTPDLTIPNCIDLTFSSSNYGTQDNSFYFFVSRLFYDGSWYDINTWETTEYSNWLSGDYTKFETTETTVNYLNGILGPAH